MYLSPTDLQNARHAALDHLQAASLVMIETAGRLAGLSLEASRRVLDEGHQQLDGLIAGSPSGLEPPPLSRLVAWRSESAEQLREAIGIIGDAHQRMLEATREQVASFDQLLMRQMDRAALSADPAGEVAIDHVRNTIRQAEAGFNELTDAAARSADLLEEQVRQVSEALSSDGTKAD
ncbi:hypothetical protein [Zoogloea sp.]|uniref:hypothetical protein n=1 Tax=Zoogloea sp. TaxID=49181 RepID=UPI001416289B|nr:MAG: hypothetical protein F9K15_12340 [Zoogloea sp.]